MFSLSSEKDPCTARKLHCLQKGSSPISLTASLPSNPYSKKMSHLPPSESKTWVTLEWQSLCTELTFQILLQDLRVQWRTTLKATWQMGYQTVSLNWTLQVDSMNYMEAYNLMIQRTMELVPWALQVLYLPSNSNSTKHEKLLFWNCQKL